MANLLKKAQNNKLLICTPKVGLKTLTFWGAFYVKRYEFEFEIKVILEYFKGHLGYKFLAKKYNISSNRVKVWVNQYRQHGTQGLSHKLTYNRYSRDFKLSVLIYRQDHMLSYRETANYFNLPHPSLITQWQTNFDKAGLLGVTQKPKGRPANMKQKQSNSNQKITNSEKEEFEGLRVENEARLYLSPVMDLYSSEIISTSINDQTALDVAIDPLIEALNQRPKLGYRATFHSDQGWHYQHAQYVNILNEHDVFQSMSRKENCLDNSPMENFFGLLKQEMFYRENFESIHELKQKIKECINFYNNDRIKTKLKDLSPIKYRKQAFEITH